MNLQRVLQTAGIDPDAIRDLHALEEPLSAIEQDYAMLYPHLTAQGATMTTFLQSAEPVHAVRMRVKDSNALLAHLLRVKAKQPQFALDPGTYTSLCADLISVLVLFEDIRHWREIHDFIMETWKVTETPCACVFPADPLQRREQFEQAGCKILPGSYIPSVRYRVPSDLAKRRIVATISVRSLMDEAYAASQRVVGANADSPLAAHYVDIMRFVGSLGMKVAAAAHEARRGAAEEQRSTPKGDFADAESRPSPAPRRPSEDKGGAQPERKKGGSGTGPDSLQATTPLGAKPRPHDGEDTEPESNEVTINAGEGEVVVAPKPRNEDTAPGDSGLGNDMTATLYVPRKSVAQREEREDSDSR